MNIGEKIKYLRQQRGMTQAELAGKHMTRNMLSRIENGAALPSVPTLRYIADMLNIDGGYFLSDIDDENIYRDVRTLPQIRQLYAAGNYTACIKFCDKLPSMSDEIAYIKTMCCFKLACLSFRMSDLKQLRSYLEQMREAEKFTVYDTDTCDYIGLLFERMCAAGASFSADDPASADIISDMLPLPSNILFLKNLSRIISHQEISPTADMEFVLQQNNDIFVLAHYKAFLNAFRDCKNGRTEDAENAFLALLNNDPAPDFFLQCLIYSMMDAIYAEKGDYKRAREYMQKKISLISG